LVGDHAGLGHLVRSDDAVLELVALKDAFDDFDQQQSAPVRSGLPAVSMGPITAPGATWLDRQLVAGEPPALGEGGFGLEVKAAMTARADRLVEEGLARRQNQQIILARDLLASLRKRELETVSSALSAETGLPHVQAASGEYVAGDYRRRLTLSSGRFAMIDDGLGFSLVPWSPSLDRHLGRHVSGVARDDGGVDWSFGRKRGLGL
jgi:Protein of unknown function (DUF3363)